MKLYYFVDKDGNFGDDLNPWFWGQLLGQKLDNDNSELVVGVGTLLNHRLPDADALHVLGSGVGYGEPPKNRNLSVRFVRGPLSAAALGISPEKAITDPAILVPKLHTVETPKRYGFGFMPHCDSDRQGDWEKVCAMAGVHYISPRQSYFDVFRKINECNCLITEAMHGAIIADAYRVPFIPTKAYDHISDFKWQDWMQSMSLNFSLHPLTPVFRGDKKLRVQQKLKNKLKRTLATVGLWSNRWTAPPPPHSSSTTIKQAAEELRALQYRTPHLSDEKIFEKNTTAVEVAIQQFIQSLDTRCP